MTKARTSVVHIVTALVVVTTLLACGSDDTDIAKLADVYADVYMSRMSSTDSVETERRYDSTLKAHGYTHEQFRKEISTLANDPEKLRALYDSMKVRLR